MPKGQTSRPYNRSIKTVAKAKKKLAGRTKNASTNKVDVAASIRKKKTKKKPAAKKPKKKSNY